MGVFSRLSDIINANLNSLLDKAEDPEKIVRLMIQEMEDTLVEVRSAAAKVIAERKERERQLGVLEQEQLDWEYKAELALSKDREDLAKAALIERQKAFDMCDQLNAEISVLDDALRASEEDIAKLQTKLRDARARQNAIMTRLESANNRVKLREMTHGSKVNDAFSRFDLLERRVDFAEGRADALSLGAPKKTLEEEIAELQSAEKVDAELAALKARMNKGE
ncbi:phage shock protein PspA [Sphingomonas sp.]|uniref:phage shock protein PspA n=1 Tax=Sphingomonas sp. TaxID=28214 RepID=UPI001ED3B3DC|nr:phage shock protein PspA [Sphingomonas sp.]MBX3592829.1 phage shock protein PspA [Sphingomonas sp.]